MNLSYGVEKVFNEDIPKLQHGNDGLIFTPLQSPYVVGTDPKMYVNPSTNFLIASSPEAILIITTMHHGSSA